MILRHIALVALVVLVVPLPGSAAADPGKRQTFYALSALAKHHPRSLRGPRGPAGPTGRQGIAGPTGPTGPQGPTGRDAVGAARISGLVLPAADSPLARGHNVAIAPAEDLPPRAWCIAVGGLDAESIVLTISLVAGGEVTIEEPELPAARWNLLAPDCAARQLEVETLVYVGGFSELKPLPFSFTGEVASTYGLLE